MVRQTVADMVAKHVTFELEAIDRMYLNAWVPSVQSGAGFVYFLKTHLHCSVPSTAMVAPMSQQSVEAIERFVERVPRTHRYRVTAHGAQLAVFYARLYARALRPTLSIQPAGRRRAQHTFERLDAALSAFLQEVHLAA